MSPVGEVVQVISTPPPLPLPLRIKRNPPRTLELTPGREHEALSMTSSTVDVHLDSSPQSEKLIERKPSQICPDVVYSASCDPMCCYPHVR